MTVRALTALSPFPGPITQPVRPGFEVTVADISAKFNELYGAVSQLSNWSEHRFKTITSAYTLVDETVVLVDTSSASVTLTLPKASEAENIEITVKKLVAANNVVVAAASGELIDGAATLSFATRWDSYVLASNGTAWYIRAVLHASSIMSKALAWWTADSISGLSDGAQVTTWADSSGNGHDLTAADSSITYQTNEANGHPAVQFLGNGGMTMASALTLAGDFTVFTVAKGNGVSGGTEVRVLSTTTPSANTKICIPCSGANDIGLSTGCDNQLAGSVLSSRPLGDAGNGGVGVGAFTETIPHLTTQSRSGNSWDLRFDGVDKQAGACTLAGTFAFNSVKHEVSGRKWLIFENIVFGGLTLAEIQEVETILNNRYIPVVGLSLSATLQFPLAPKTLALGASTEGYAWRTEPEVSVQQDIIVVTKDATETYNSETLDTVTARNAAIASVGAGYQPLDSDLTAIAALATTSFGRALLALADAAAGRTALALGTLATQDGTFSGTSSGTNTGDQTNITGNAATVTTNANLTGPITSVGNTTTVADAELAAIAGLTSAADRLPYFIGSGTASLATFTTAGRALIDDADVSAQRTTLGLGTLATQSGTFSGTSSGTNTGDQTLSDATISTTDVTTNNASTSKHGFLKKLDNDPTHFMDGQGNWSTAGGGAQTPWVSDIDADSHALKNLLDPVDPQDADTLAAREIAISSFLSTDFGTGTQTLSNGALRMNVGVEINRSAVSAAFVVYDDDLVPILATEPISGSPRIGFFGVSPSTQIGPNATGYFNGGSGHGLRDDTTFDGYGGGFGGSVYTVDDIIHALKEYGLLAP